MNKFLVYIFVVFLVGCTNEPAPTFESMKSNYNNHEETFSKLAEYACRLGEEKELIGYLPNDDKYKKNTTLDNYLSIIGGKNVLYKKNKNGTCSLSVFIWGIGFAGSGQSYRYKYQIDNPSAYDAKKHTKEDIIKSKTQDEFDMELEYKDVFNGWYFNYKYS